jgi:RNA polymerase sigma factor (sigma-70 family)
MTCPHFTPLFESPVLRSRIRSISRKYGHQAEDVEQHIWLTLFNLAEKDSAFARQSPGYWIKRAKWEGQRYIHACSTYDRYVESEQVIEGDYGEEVSNFDLISNGCPTPEEEVERRQFYAAVNTLPIKQKQVIEMLLIGYRPDEIANKLGVSRSSVSHFINRARTQLAGMGV